jgi:hypothetical protein
MIVHPALTPPTVVSLGGTSIKIGAVVSFASKAAAWEALRDAPCQSAMETTEIAIHILMNEHYGAAVRVIELGTGMTPERVPQLLSILKTDHSLFQAGVILPPEWGNVARYQLIEALP